jgi:uncharacterized protein YnzC (UPF0291/DUF896 family)
MKTKGSFIMEKSKINRINELARKSKAEGLTDAEKAEQHDLRQEFLDEIRSDVKASLESIEIVDDVKPSNGEIPS